MFTLIEHLILKLHFEPEKCKHMSNQQNLSNG